MKGWTQRAKDAKKECETCKEQYSPKLRCDGTYESEIHFNESHSCGKKCSAIRIARMRKEKADQQAEKRQRLSTIRKAAMQTFLYPGCDHATADKIRARGFL